MGINVKFFDPSDPKNVEAAITDKTKAVFCETIGNPALELVDIQAIADIAHAHGLPLIVDSTFTPPVAAAPDRTWGGHRRAFAYQMAGRTRHRSWRRSG